MPDGAVNRNAAFTTTHWSVVLKAKDQDSAEAREALSELCRWYWYPLYAYVRGRGRSVEDSQDLTQEFFARLIEKNYLGIADRRKGRFRWFLLTAFKGFLANEHDRATAAKRGGGRTPISLDAMVAENQFKLESSSDLSPDKLFDRRWALSLLQKVRFRLRDEYSAAHRAERFEMLECYLPGERLATTYSQAGERLGISENAVKLEVRRMKKQFGELLREEIGRTVANEEEVDEELRYLKAAIS